ncbi:MAG: hypothetical protein KDA93_03810 [Planctomycetaceae bacterium]|nr:hypothetical protein [Planctomycetaceae bacterium]
MRRVLARSNFDPTGSSRRGGASLIEVMMATLIMGVGVLSVMALFPIAYLRSIQASQLTNAVLLKEQAEIVVDNFDLVSDVYIPQPANGDINSCIIDPLGVFDNLGDSYGAVSPQTYSPTTGAPSYFQLITGGTPPDTLPRPLRRLGFQGANRYNTDGYESLTPDLFPLGTREEVLDAVGLVDRWETVFTANPITNTNTTVTFDPNQIDLGDLDDLETQRTNGVDLRVILVDITGKRSDVRFPTAFNQAPAANGIGWTVNLSPDMGAIAECRVEVPDRRFTWMLTVRKTGQVNQSTTEIDCVVYHNRPSLDPEEELVHTVTGISGADVDVTFTAYTSGDAAPLRKGGFVFDPAHAKWYQVQNIPVETATTATITLDRFPTETIPVLTIPRGVVGVYPLRTRTRTGQ